VDYLLNPDHRYGASKARFFGGFGFHREAWEVLRDALCEHGRNWDVKRVTETGFGPRYEVEGELEVQTVADRGSVLFLAVPVPCPNYRTPPSGLPKDDRRVGSFPILLRIGRVIDR
jgi:hypothetical protein